MYVSDVEAVILTRGDTSRALLSEATLDWAGSRGCKVLPFVPSVSDARPNRWIHGGVLRSLGRVGRIQGQALGSGLERPDLTYTPVMA